MQLWSLRASQRLHQAETMFLTGASHNLRTPLSAIRAAAQTLSSPSVGEADRALLLDAILHETTRLELRVDNLLETARIDLEQKSYAAGASALDLGALVREVHDEARWAFTARGGSFEVWLPEEPLFVAGDRRALRLLFENLVDNALKYSERAPRVSTSIGRSAEHAVVRVRDEGLGFASGSDLFSRPATGDVKRRGAGLGLRLARAIARGHGGQLNIESPGPGQGATAEVWLPLDEE
jgi:two-component system phosphate regulon sensor histidine kinase PhoR